MRTFPLTNRASWCHMKMKHSIIIAAVALTCSIGSIAFAASWWIDQKRAPRIALPDAYRLATTALGSATNEFHCTRAEFVGEECAPGSWRFDFYSTNGTPKFVFACPDGSTRVYDNSLPLR